MSRRSLKSLAWWVVPLAVVACSGGPGGLAGPGTSNSDPAPNGQQPTNYSQQPPTNPFQPIRAGTVLGNGGSTGSGGCGNLPSGCTCVCQNQHCAVDCQGSGGGGGFGSGGGPPGIGGTSGGSCTNPSCQGCPDTCTTCLCLSNDNMTVCTNSNMCP